jgi:predicted peptidase
MRQQARTFEVQFTRTVRLNYLLYLPRGYNVDPQKKWPLILFLHGAGERGDDLELVKIHGIPKIVEQQEDFPFITVSPQCPADAIWAMEAKALKVLLSKAETRPAVDIKWMVEVEALSALLDEVVSEHTVDTERVYLTGLSMGGYGAWRLATAYPGRFAAIAPICGGGDPEKAGVLRDVPVWVFHGAQDPAVLLSESEKMVDALGACGGNVRFTVYPDAEHDSWTRTYDNPELYEWFLQHTRQQKR